MDQAQLLQLLGQLRKLPHETEWVEFKEANAGYDFRKLGKYFSALSNEANLKNQPCGWLVFGVVNNAGSKRRSEWVLTENLAIKDAIQQQKATRNRRK